MNTHEYPMAGHGLKLRSLKSLLKLDEQNQDEIPSFRMGTKWPL